MSVYNSTYETVTTPTTNYSLLVKNWFSAWRFFFSLMFWEMLNHHKQKSDWFISSGNTWKVMGALFEGFVVEKNVTYSSVK